MKITESRNINWEKVKNLLFDLGGVIVDINFDNTINAFKELGLDNFQNHYTQKVQSDFFVRYETGKISSEQMREELKMSLKAGTTNDQIDIAWCAMLGDTPQKNIELLKLLKKKYNMFLLSNTNEIHIDYYLEKVKRENNEFFPDCFNKLYYSHVVGLHKPDSEIFTYVMSDAGIKPEETLYIDDTEMHIDSAAGMGFQAFHLKKGMTIHDIFQEKL